MTVAGSPTGKKDYMGLFAAVVRAAFLGDTYQLDGRFYRLKPTLLDKYEVLRSIANPASELERLVRDLPSDFKSVAKSELYRKQGGWMDRGFEKRRLREVELDGKPHVLPCLEGPTVGIDTSSNESLTFVCIACFDDAKRGHVYLEKHLQLPKSKEPNELKWMKLNSTYRNQVIQNLSTLLSISCNALLVIKTSALISPAEKKDDIFIKLISGCFSGYESVLGESREKMRESLFGLTNNTPVHCDADFSPLTTDKIVRILVRTLSAGQSFIPLHVGLKSEESHPIQVADVICGAVKTMIMDKIGLVSGLNPVPFDNKLRGEGKDAKAYYWNRESTQVPRAVTM